MAHKQGQATFCRCLFIIVFIVEQVGLMLLMQHQLIAAVVVLLLSAIGAIGLQCWYAKLRSSKAMIWADKAKLVMILLVAIIVVEVLIVALMQYFDVGASANQQVINHYLQVPEDYFVMGVSLVIIAPIVEEGLFRTAIIGRTSQPWLFGVISTAMFVMVHVALAGSFTAVLLHCLQYAVLGAVFSFGYCYTEDWRVNTVLHGLWNLMTIMI